MSSAPAPLTVSPTASDSASPTAPPSLSPDIVASLQLDLSWLDLRTPPSVPSASSSEAGWSSHASASGSGRATPLATLAARRITTQMMQRPPLARRRSKSLDDVASHASGSGDSTPDVWRREEVRNGRDEANADANDPLRIDMMALHRARGALEVRPSATTASSRTASVAHSVTGSTITATGAEQVPQHTRRRRSKAEDEAEEDRLAKWVRSASGSSASSAGSAEPIAAAPSPRLGTPGRVPIPSRQPYAPVLPSPLSTCSYTSEDDAREEEDGFPFPSTPHPSTSTPMTASTTQSESSSPAAEAKPPGSTPRKSPQLIRRQSSSARPNYHSYPSASTVTSSTATAVSTPAGPPEPPTAPVSPSALNLTSACSREAPLLARAATDPLIPQAVAPAPPPPPVAAAAHAIVGAPSSSRTRSHTRGTSVSSSSQRPPLTPPESLSISPHLYGASAAELAWHDVLNARFGALAVSDLRFPTQGASYTGGSGSTRDSRGGGARRAGGGGANGAEATTPDQESGPRGGWCGNELMGKAAAGGFATSTKDHLASMLDDFVEQVPLEEGEETVHIVEYGALNSRRAPGSSRVV